MKNGYKFIISLIPLLMLVSCASGYSVLYFSYPPGSKVHEKDWSYYGGVIVLSPTAKKFTSKGNRKIEIFIKDKNNIRVLEDSFRLDCASLDRKTKWEEFEKLTIELCEEGNPYSEDDYNKRLIKEGPKHILTLSYIWNGNKFEKITEPNK